MAAGGRQPDVARSDVRAATVTHDGHAWTHVGMRYKGNSSLVASIGSGNGKLPFRLNFDQYEKTSRPSPASGSTASGS